MPDHIAISDRFVDQCSPVIGSNFDTCGTVTLSTIDHLSKDDLDAIFRTDGQWKDLTAWFFHSMEMKACGVRKYFWYDWIMANAERSAFRSAFNAAVMAGSKVVRGQGLLEPFVKARQVSVVNRGYWKMENSIRVAEYAATPTTNQAIGDITDGPLEATTGGQAVIRVSARHNIPNDSNEFLPGKVIHLFTVSATGVHQISSYKIVDSASDDSLTYIDLLVVSENAGSSSPFFQAATTGASNTSGVIVPGINNVNDYEKWCHNRPNIDPRKMVPFWYQTYRETRCVDAEYMEVYQRLLVANPAFKEFGDLDMAERNRQDEHEAQKAFVNAFFFQKPISANQTLSNWESLEDISTFTEVDLAPGLGGKLKAKRANWVGVVEQLRACGRVKDLYGNQLNLEEFFAEIRQIAKARRSQGRKVTHIDVWMSELMRKQFYLGMIAYYKQIFGSDNLQFNFQLGQNNEDLGITFDTYQVLYPSNVKINVISDEFFDDWYDEGAAISEQLGWAHNLILILDIGKPGPQGGTIYYAQVAANRKTYTSAKIEELARLDKNFRCVMETTSQEQTLQSETGMPVVECPLNSLWIQGVRLMPPDHTGESAEDSDLYTYYAG